MLLLWFLVIAYQHSLSAQDVPVKYSAWSTSPQYSNRIELPVLFESRRQNTLACTIQCATVPNCDVIIFTKSSKQCLGYTSALTSPTTPSPTSSPYTTSSSPTFNTVVMKRVCAGVNYTFVADLNWCVQLVVTPKAEWSGAQLACEGNGGKLAVLDTFDKYSYIYDNFYDYYYDERLWVGGTLDTELWYFTTGEVLDQAENYWHQVFMDDPTENGTCLSYYNSVFSSGACGNFHPFLCEEVW